MASREEVEYKILQIMADAVEPVGSGTLSEILVQAGYNVSEATAGRLLRYLDVKGFAAKVGFKGRVLTEDGRRKLEELRAEREREFYGHQLVDVLRTHGKEGLVDILVARRAIERETARLAALNATPEEVRRLEKIVETHDAHVSQGIGGADEDVQFHRLIAETSRNKVLQAAAALIRQDGQLSSALEYIRKQAKSTVVTDHRRILAAIQRRSSADAEQMMVQHVENLIRDVEKYWRSGKIPGG